MKISHIVGLLLIGVVPSAFSITPVVQHELDVVLLPDQGQIQVIDNIQLPPELIQRPFCWSLQAGLNPNIENDGVLLTLVKSNTPHQENFCVTLPAGKDRFSVRYSGAMRYPEIPVKRSTTRPPLTSEGAYLNSANAWYPHSDQALISFRMTVKMPKSWRVVTQGERQARDLNSTHAIEIWQERNPQEEIYLVATSFHEYQNSAKTEYLESAQALVFLRQPDPELAQRYLQTTTQFINFYSDLLGPYAYSKFALVENFWESGYGMPSFTLLGPRVMRFPFILHTSYPHEILHSWWGNGVYVDYSTGNWAEGLTTYLADYLVKEQQGRGAEFRRDVLQRYGNFVRNDEDFPLSQFGARHNETAQSVGYDKSLMFFHMLRQRLGDRGFLAGLQRIYRQYRFRRAGFAELRYVFEQVSGNSLADEFEQWVESTGVPELQLESPQVKRDIDGYRLTAVLKQVQPGPAYKLRVPLAVQLEREQAWQTTITMSEKRTLLTLKVPSLPERLAIDPEFDLMRRLSREEVPPSISQLFGDDNSLVVLSSSASDKLKQAHLKTAQTWVARYGAEIVWDQDLATLPNDRSIWLFGWENRFRTQFADHLRRQATLTDDTLQLHEQTFGRDEFGSVIVTWHPHNRNQALAWVAWEQHNRFSVMTQKLSHYGKYSYLTFSGDRAKNNTKGQWMITTSPLNQVVGTASSGWRARLAPRPALATIPPAPPLRIQDTVHKAQSAQ